MNTAQLRWCLREDIRIEAMRDLVNTSSGTARFNEIVEGYNACCGEFRYYESDMARARRDVESERASIKAAALTTAMELDGRLAPVAAAVAPPPETLSMSPRDRIVRIQELLAQMGYAPGMADGVAGLRTANAVQAFQMDYNFLVDGLADEETLLGLLRLAGPDSPGAKALPANGTVQATIRAPGLAPLEVRASGDAHYLVKLVNARSGSEALTLFVRRGMTAEVQVPLGTCELRYASGDVWCGYDRLFGPATSYSKADETFDFRDAGTHYTGYTVTLYKVSDGNLSTSEIPPEQF